MISSIRKMYRWYHRPKSKFLEYVEAFFVIVPLAFFIRTFFYGLYQVPTGSMETTMLVGERFLADKLTVWFMPIKHGDIIAFNDPNYSYSDNYVINMWQRYVWGPSNWTKRVIGIPGDHIKGVIENGHPVVYRNGEKLDEPYLNKYPILPVFSEKPTPWSLLSRMSLHYKSFDPQLPYDKQPFYRIDPCLVASQYASIRYPGTEYPGGIDVFDVTLGENEYWVMGDNRLGSYDSRGWGKLDGKLIHAKIIFRFLSVDPINQWLVLDLLAHPVDFWTRVRWGRCFQPVH